MSKIGEFDIQQRRSLMDSSQTFKNLKAGIWIFLVGTTLRKYGEEREKMAGLPRHARRQIVRYLGFGMYMPSHFYDTSSEVLKKTRTLNAQGLPEVVQEWETYTNRNYRDVAEVLTIWNKKAMPFRFNDGWGTY